VAAAEAALRVRRALPSAASALLGLLTLLAALVPPAAPLATVPVAVERYVLVQRGTPVGDVQRAYYLAGATTAPRRATSLQRALPLVVLLHGRYQVPSQVMAASGLAELGRARGFAVAVPGAYGGGWNAGTCCSTGAQNNMPDVAFLDQVVNDVAARRRIDRRRVYVAGFSNGGMLAYRYACERPGRVAAIGVVAGAMALATPDHLCRPDRPVGVVHVHGAADTTVPYAGGPLPGGEGPVASAPASVGELAAAAGCTGRRSTRTGAAVRSDATGCRAPGGAALVRVDDLGHTWTRDAARYGVDSTAALWEFFAGRSSG
jgi:polyhydroxybutyrate depolymerase